MTTTASLLHFSYLQLLDFLTTVAFLLHGVQEGNPVVQAAMAWSSSPWLGLALVKLAALVLGAYCWQSGRYTLLGRTNRLFAVLVAWNLVAIIVGAAGAA